MYNIGTGGNGGGMTGGICSPVVTMPGSIQILEALQNAVESLDTLATRPLASNSINVEIPEIRIPQAIINVPKIEMPAAPAAYVTVRFEVPKIFLLCITGLPSLAVAAIYFTLKHFGG